MRHIIVLMLLAGCLFAQSKIMPRDLSRETKVLMADTAKAIAHDTSAAIQAQLRSDIGDSLLADIAGQSINIRDHIESENVLNAMDDVFGVAGDGLTDDATAFQSLIDAADERATIKIPGGNYRIATRLAVTKSLNIEGDPSDPAVFLPDNGVSPVFGIYPDAIDTTTLKIDAHVSDRYIIVDDGALFTQGTMVSMQSADSSWYYEESINKGELHKVYRTVDGGAAGDTVWFEDMVYDNYDVSEEDVNVYLFPYTTGGIKNIKFIYNNAAANNSIYCLNIFHAMDFKVKNIHTVYGGGGGIHMKQCYNSSLEKSSFFGHNGASLGYGAVISSCNNVRVEGNTFAMTRSGMDVGGVEFASRNITVNNNTAYGTSVDVDGDSITTSPCGFSTHGASENVTFSNNTVVNKHFGFKIRGTGTFIENNKLYGTMSIGVYMISGCNLSAKSNTYDPMYSGKQSIPTYDVRTASLDRFVEISSNITSDSSTYVNISYNSVYGINGIPFIANSMPTLWNLTAIGNDVGFNRVSGDSYFIHSGSAKVLQNAYFEGNHIKSENAFYFFHPSYVSVVNSTVIVHDGETHFVHGSFNYYTDAGSTADSIQITVPELSGHIQGHPIWVKVDAETTGATVVQINSDGWKALLKMHDQAIAAGDIETGQIIQIMYDGTQYQLISPLAQ